MIDGVKMSRPSSLFIGPLHGVRKADAWQRAKEMHCLILFSSLSCVFSFFHSLNQKMSGDQGFKVTISLCRKSATSRTISDSMLSLLIFKNCNQV